MNRSPQGTPDDSCTVRTDASLVELFAHSSRLRAMRFVGMAVLSVSQTTDACDKGF